MVSCKAYLGTLDPPLELPWNPWTLPNPEFLFSSLSFCSWAFFLSTFDTLPYYIAPPCLHPGPSWGHLGAFLDLLGTILGHPGHSAGLLGATLGPSWLSLGHIGASLAPSWATSEPSWAMFCPSWADLVPLGLLMAHSRPGPCQYHFGATASAC